MGLLDFIIGIVLLVATGAVFFLVIDRIARDALLNQIAKIGVGVVLLIGFLFAVKAVLFGGGGGVKIDPHGFLFFCIGVIIILVALLIIEWVVNWIGGKMGLGGSDPNQPQQAGAAPAGLAGIINYVIFAVALIAMLVLADQTLLGGSFSGSFGNFNMQRLSR